MADFLEGHRRGRSGILPGSEQRCRESVPRRAGACTFTVVFGGFALPGGSVPDGPRGEPAVLRPGEPVLDADVDFSVASTLSPGLIASVA